MAASNIAKAKELKEQGNAAFKEGKYGEAIAAYHQIYMYVHGYSESSGGHGGIPGQTTTPVTQEEMAQIRELKVAHHCNLAMCFLKHGPKYAKARDNCTKALAIDPDNVKALFRRGKCYAQLNALDEAKADLDRVLQLQPDNTDAKRELRALRGAFDKVRKKEQKKFAGMFDKMQDQERAEEAAAAAAAAAIPSPPPPSATGTSADSAPVAPVAGSGAPAESGVDVPCSVGTDAASGLGDRLSDPAAFEPTDVHYAK